MARPEEAQAYDLAVLATAVKEATEHHRACTERERAASSETTAAVNRLNGAQRAFDAAVEKLRAEAPWNTDWHAQRHDRGEPVSA